MASPAMATSITLSNFSNTQGLTLSGSATPMTTSDGTVLRLAPASPSQAGNVFSTTTINASNFSTVFQFRMTNPGGVTDDAGISGADGLTFIVQSLSNSAGGSGNGAGYGGIPNSVGVKFDTFENNTGYGALSDPSSNFVGIYTDGSVNSAGVPTANVSPNFDDGNLWTAWVDYDGTTLNVYASESDVKPAVALVSEKLDIASILGQDTAYVGFGASTGSAWENTDIVNWSYSDSYNPTLTTATVSEPASMGMLGAGLLAMGVLRRRRA